MNVQTEILKIVNLKLLINVTGVRKIAVTVNEDETIMLFFRDGKPEPEFAKRALLATDEKHLPRLRLMRHHMEMLLAECEREQAERGQERAA